MFRVRRAAVVVAALAVLCAARTDAADSVLLRRVYKPGERIVAFLSSRQDVSQTTADGAVGTAKQRQDTVMTMDVLRVLPDDSAEVKVTWTRIAFSVTAPELTIDYDSTDPVRRNVDHSLLRVFKIVAGKSIMATVTNRGEVTAIRGIAEIIEGAVGKIPEGPDRTAARQSLTRVLSEEGFKQQLSIFGVPLPAEAKAVGDSWQWDQPIRLDFAELTVHTVCKVDKITDKAVLVSVSSTTKVTRTSPGVTVALDPASRNAGLASIDRANAALSSGTAVSSMVMTVGIRGQSLVSRTTGASSLSVTKK